MSLVWDENQVWRKNRPNIWDENKDDGTVPRYFWDDAQPQSQVSQFISFFPMLELERDFFFPSHRYSPQFLQTNFEHL